MEREQSPDAFLIRGDNRCLTEVWINIKVLDGQGARK